jgi:hypothetical protein
MARIAKVDITFLYPSQMRPKMSSHCAIIFLQCWPKLIRLWMHIAALEKIWKYNVRANHFSCAYNLGALSRVAPAVGKVGRRQRSVLPLDVRVPHRHAPLVWPLRCLWGWIHEEAEFEWARQVKTQCTAYPEKYQRLHASCDFRTRINRCGSCRYTLVVRPIQRCCLVLKKNRLCWNWILPYREI